MAKYIMTVRSNPVAGREHEYNRWYDAHQLPELLKTPSFVAAQRYRTAPVQLPEYPGYERQRYSYLVVYEIETDDIEQTRQLLWSPGNVARITPSPAFDTSSVDLQIFEPTGPRVLAPR